MIVFPAIDVLAGRTVRLQKGLRDNVTDYGAPEDMAAAFKQKGAEWLHMVDLSAAFDGKSENGEVIKRAVQAFHGNVQLGGGIRTLEDVILRIEDYGVKRVIIGTAAVESPGMVAAACKRFPGRIACGIDAKSGMAALRGWVKESGVTAVELGLRMKDCGVDTVIYTDIDMDGMMQGPNIAQTKEMIEKTGLQIIGSGGVNSLESLRALKEIDCYGAITGRALYEKVFTLEEALMA